MGLRLPLAGLAADRFRRLSACAARRPVCRSRQAAGASTGLPRRRHVSRTTTSARPRQPGSPVRTALAVEVRDGHLCVFLPPLSEGADYAALIAAIEAAAARTRQAIRLEGYPPPFDPRLRCIKVTPDPGVIEVNVHPAASWDETVAITSTVYEEAAQIGPRRGEVQARRASRRHRRRQPHRARRPHAGGQPVPEAARPARQPHRLLAEPPVPLLSVRRPVRRADQPGAARGRGAPRVPLRARDRAAPAARAGPRGRPLAGGPRCSATCWSMPPATPTGPRSASTSSTRPKARWAAWAWSSSAPSRCRRTRA